MRRDDNNATTTSLRKPKSHLAMQSVASREYSRYSREYRGRYVNAHISHAWEAEEERGMELSPFFPRAPRCFPHWKMR